MLSRFCLVVSEEGVLNDDEGPKVKDLVIREEEEEEVAVDGGLGIVELKTVGGCSCNVF